MRLPGHGYEVSASIGKRYFLMPYSYNTADLLNTAISSKATTERGLPSP